MNSVVTLTIERGIAIVQMVERDSHNTFSHALIRDLIKTFDFINAHQEVKVVVIHGHDNYFCCGGTQEELLNLQTGTMNFADLGFYRLLLDCKVPTIAAMQGHAIGGGLAFGCFADLIILAEECIYSTNFMKYGFTPGMGATYIIPYKFGQNIGQELLYTANTYHGITLREKCAPVTIVKKSQVIITALTLAEQLADKPSHSLKILKRHLTQEICLKLPSIIEQEIAMHSETFNLPDVKHRIEQLFGT
ncbi:MAG: enoyl-CoA hydratase/isomerase family protein [Legionella sp.]|nr:enoyl-CoA hydratase/isomerase family protein [Legionella sp.]